MENEQEKLACLNCSISKFDEKYYCNYEMKGDLDMICLVLGDILIQIAKDMERTPSEVAAECLTMGTIRRMVEQFRRNDNENN